MTRRRFYLLVFMFSFFVCVSGLTSAYADGMHDGKMRKNPWEDSGIVSSYADGTNPVQYMDFLIPYDTTVQEVGGSSGGSFRNHWSADYTHDIFQIITTRYFGQSYVVEFGARKVYQDYFQNANSSYHNWWVDPSVTFEQLKGGAKAVIHVSKLVTGTSQDWVGTQSDGYCAYDSQLKCLYFIVNGVRIFPGCLTQNSFKLGKVLAEDPSTGVSGTFFDLNTVTGENDALMDMYLVDGTCIHFFQFDTFGGAHSVGSGIIKENGTVNETPYTIRQISEAMTGSDSEIHTDDVTGKGGSYWKNGAWTGGFFYAVGDSKWQGSTSGWADTPLYWYNTKTSLSATAALFSAPNSTVAHIQDGTTFGCKPMSNVAYAYSVHANGCYVSEIVGCDDGANYMQTIFGWSTRKEGDTEGLDKRMAVVRAYNLTFEEFCINGDKYKILAGLENTSGFGKASANFVGGAGYHGSDAASYFYDTNQAMLKKVSEEWTTMNLLMEDNLMSLFDYDKNPLSQNEVTAFKTWYEMVESEKQGTSVVRVIVQVVGIIMLVWAILFYLSYWVDTLNTFFSFSLMSVLTLGKLTPITDESASDKGLVSHRRALFIAFVTFAIGVSLISGLVYTLLLYLITGIKSVL